VRGSILPVTIPPRETPGTGALGWGIVYGGLVPRVGSRANQKIALCSWFIKRNGDAPLAGRREFFCRKAASLFWLGWNKNNPCKLKPIFEGKFI